MLSPRRAPRQRLVPGFRRAVVVALSTLVVPFGFTGVARAEESVSDGTRTLSVSRTTDLSEAGETIVVTGSGYDESKGVYVGLCVVTSPDVQPSPCGGGIDRAGATGASEWISSNPPSYAIGLPIPYETGGSFVVELSVSPTINDVVDCRNVQCAIVTKSDHTIIDDRSQDLLIPVTFTGVAPSTTVTVDSAPSTPSETAPEITVADNVSDLAATATDTDGGVNGVLIGVVALIVAAAAVALIAVRRTRTNDR